MVSSNRKRFNSASETLDSEKPSPQIFQTLLSAIESPEGLEPSLLGSLYVLLVHLSSLPPVLCSKDGSESNYWAIAIDHYSMTVTFKDICGLSNLLFKESQKRFDQILHINVSSASQARGQFNLQTDMWTNETSRLLLRCCMVILNLLVPDQYLLMENGIVLLAILRKLCSLDLIEGMERNSICFQKLLSFECTYGANDCMASFTEDFVASLRFLEPSDPRLPFLCMMLEVFADEFLVNGQLREYLKLIDSVSSTSRRLLVHHFSHGDIGSVLEVMSTHFFLSYIDEQAFGNFLNRMFWLEMENSRSLELSLTASISLLQNPVMVSAPKFFHAHLISMVSESSGFEKMRPDLKLMDCYLSAFERSVILYTKHMSGLQTDGKHASSEGCFVKSRTHGVNVQSSFESYIRPTTSKKINHLISNLETSWFPHLHTIFCKTKLELKVVAIKYMKDIQVILEPSCRDDIVPILSYIIQGALSGGDDTMLNTNRDASAQDLCLLASLLKLMSISLLQVLWCLRRDGDTESPRSLNDFSSCKEYNSMAGIMSCLGQFKLRLPIQKSLSGILETQPTRNNVSKLMLVHFSGLLSFTFGSGLDFLVKGCLLTMMTAMNLFIFEGGDVMALRSLIDSGLHFVHSGLPLDNIEEAVDQRSSLIVASKFQKIQALHLSAASHCTGRKDGQGETLINSLFENNMEDIIGIEEETEETCNGKIFLKCVLEGSGKLSDIDDLADFIECNPGKNYSDMLKDRQRYRKWKCEKMAVLRWKKKKRAWNFTKGKKT